MKKSWLFILLLLILVPGVAQAENCKNLAKNDQWQEDMQYVKSAIGVQEWEDALSKARTMYKQCSQVPLLNYYVAVSLQGKGDNIKALEFFQKAANLTVDNETTPEDSQLVWYARYEAEHPDRTDRAILEKQTQYAMDEKKYADLEAEMSEYIRDEYDESIQRVKLGMWSGVGVGAAGIVMSAIGAYLAFHTDDNFDILGPHEYTMVNVGDNTYEPQSLARYELKSSYKAGLGLLGAGLSLTAIGVIFAGIYGYHYTHVKMDDADVSLHAGLQSIGMTVRF